MIWLNIPFMIFPLIFYNIVELELISTGSFDPWASAIWSPTMISGAIWTMNLGHVLLVVGLILLFFEIIKATRIGSSAIMDHLFSTFIFIAYLVEFLLFAGAAHPIFFLLLVMALIDVVAGFSISIRTATRDVNLGDAFGR